MKLRRLGKTGPLVSALGYGCMGISEFYGAALPKATALQLLQSVFHEHDITFFDTADMYGNGANEELLGEAVASFRDKIIVATKCGIDRIGAYPRYEINNSPEYIKRCCEASLKRLNMDCIDVYYLHRYNPNASIEQAMMAMQELINEGKIAYVGLSEVEPEIIKRAHAILGDKLVAIQTEYSIRNKTHAEALLPTCRELGLSFVAYSPIGRGALAGTLKNVDNFDEGDYRKALPQFQPENFEQNLQLVDVLKNIGEQKGCTPAQLSLAWLLAQGEDIIPIPGTGNPKHLKENVASAQIVLTEADLSALSKASVENPAAGLRMPEDRFNSLKLRG